jgi:hypothetical protein
MQSAGTHRTSEKSLRYQLAASRIQDGRTYFEVRTTINEHRVWVSYHLQGSPQGHTLPFLSQLQAACACTCTCAATAHAHVLSNQAKQSRTQNHLQAHLGRTLCTGPCLWHHRQASVCCWNMGSMPPGCCQGCRETAACAIRVLSGIALRSR